MRKIGSFEWGSHAPKRPAKSSLDERLSTSIAAGHHGRTAAVHEQFGAGYEIGIIRDQEQHGTREIYRFPGAVAQIDYLAVWIELVFSDGRADLVRYHAVHANIVWRELDSERTGQIDHPGFRGG